MNSDGMTLRDVRGVEENNSTPLLLNISISRLIVWRSEYHFESIRRCVERKDKQR
jgi:hypothetical protein